jgi:hypothetical protein
MSAVMIAVLALTGTALTGLVTWLVAARAASGRVETTDAATLWEESRAIRVELRKEADTLRQRVDKLSEEVEECHADGIELRKRLVLVEAQLRSRD